MGNTKHKTHKTHKHTHTHPCIHTYIVFGYPFLINVLCLPTFAPNMLNKIHFCIRLLVVSIFTDRSAANCWYSALTKSPYTYTYVHTCIGNCIQIFFTASQSLVALTLLSSIFFDWWQMKTTNDNYHLYVCMYACMYMDSYTYICTYVSTQTLACIHTNTVQNLLELYQLT